MSYFENNTLLSSSSTSIHIMLLYWMISFVVLLSPNNADIVTKEYNAKILKTNERIIMGKMSDEQGDDLIRKFKYEIENLGQNVLHWETQLLNMTCEYQTLDMGIYQKSVDNVIDEKERYDIIHQCISVVWVDKIGFARYKYEIMFVDDTSVRFETVPNNHNRILLDNGTWEYFKPLNRFIRK